MTRRTSTQKRAIVDFKDNNEVLIGKLFMYGAQTLLVSTVMSAPQPSPSPRPSQKRATTTRKISSYVQAASIQKNGSSGTFQHFDIATQPTPCHQQHRNGQKKTKAKIMDSRGIEPRTTPSQDFDELRRSCEMLREYYTTKPRAPNSFHVFSLIILIHKLRKFTYLGRTSHLERASRTRLSQ